jgi:alkylated DNA repair protein alkB family protein 8
MAAHEIQAPPLPTTDFTDPRIQRWPDIGLTLIHDFISESEEAAMVAAFHAVDPRTGGRKRLSQHFGHHFDYTTFGASEAHFTPVPAYIADLLPRLPVQDYLPDQFTVQYYPPGAGIPPHVDTHSMFAEALYSLSFGSAVPMVFRMSGPNDARKMRLPKRSLAAPDTDTAPTTASTTPTTGRSPGSLLRPESEQAQEHEHASWELLLPRRSLLLMTGPSRYGYTHGIKARKTDVIDGRPVLREGRYSITMRTVRRGPEVGCSCDFPGVCDARIREELAKDRSRP